MRLLPLAAILILSACTAEQPTQNDPAPEPPVAPKPSVAPEAPAANDANEAMPPFAEVPGAHPYPPPAPAPIPAKFRGSYAEDKAACADLKHPSRLTISGQTVRFPTFVIFGDTVTASGNQFAVKGKIEGTHRRAEAQYFISADGKTLTDGGGGGAVRVRCQ